MNTTLTEKLFQIQVCVKMSGMHHLWKNSKNPPPCPLACALDLTSNPLWRRGGPWRTGPYAEA